LIPIVSRWIGRTRIKCWTSIETRTILCTRFILMTRHGRPCNSSTASTTCCYSRSLTYGNFPSLSSTNPSMTESILLSLTTNHSKSSTNLSLLIVKTMLFSFVASCHGWRSWSIWSESRLRSISLLRSVGIISSCIVCWFRRRILSACLVIMTRIGLAFITSLSTVVGGGDGCPLLGSNC